MWNEYSPLRNVAVRSPEHAFSSNEKINAEWQTLRFYAPPDLDSAIAEHKTFVKILEAAGAEVNHLPGGDGLTLDSIYVRDAALATPGGLILCRMGRKTRGAEPKIYPGALPGIPVLGAIEAPGTLEGGDFIWLDEVTAVVGLGPRTNKEGIRQLWALLGDGVELHVVALNAPGHPDDVFHLMSMISPVDTDLAVIYRPLMPKRFLDWLEGKGMNFVEVPEDEWLLMACNVLALSPRHVLMLDGLPKTKALMKAAGCVVQTYKGDNISRMGEGGPTCLTRPLVRG
ncbi:MAG: amidinotransferase [Alphaproteobacteria bacterium]|nr:MAG: amidinotransferase [Alphaproteobacteria bacterium]